MNRQSRPGINIGTSSLLLIFVVLSLISFAVLSLSSALSDKHLEQKSLEHTQDYYDACNRAEEKYAAIDKQAYEAYCGGKLSPDTYTLVETINSTQELHVTIRTHLPNEFGKLSSIDEWRVVNVNIPEIDDHLDVFQ